MMMRFRMMAAVASLAALGGCEKAPDAATQSPGSDAAPQQEVSSSTKPEPAPGPPAPVVANRTLKGFGPAAPPDAPARPDAEQAEQAEQAEPEPPSDFGGFAKLRTVARTASIVAAAPRPTSYDPPKSVDSVGTLVKFEKIGPPRFSKVLRPVTFGSKLPIAPQPEPEDVVAHREAPDGPLVSFEKISRPPPPEVQFEKLERSARRVSRPALKLKAFD